MSHPVEREQAKVQEFLGDLSIHEGVRLLLDLDEDEAAELIAAQLNVADRNVPLFIPAMRSVRRAAVGAGFVSGVTFAVAAMRAREARE